MAANNYTNIIAWQKAHDFVIDVYDKTKKFPEYERHGLWSQFTRAAVSVAANIAEGHRKMGKADKLRFMNTAQGSLDECRYYILLAHDLHYITDEDFQTLEYKASGASWYLNAYVEGIRNNAGIKD